METWTHVLNGNFRQMLEALDENSNCTKLTTALQQFQPKVKRIFDAYLNAKNQPMIMTEALRVKQDEKVMESIKGNL